MIERKIGSKDHASSNLFLRCLWAELRNRFGAMGWQYTPRRYGEHNQIRFGWVTLGNISRSRIEVGIKYRRKGIVELVYFDPEGASAEIHSNFDALINESVDAALSKHSSPPEFDRCMRVTSIPNSPVAYYRGEKWYIGPLKDGSTEIGMTVRAFDDADLDYEFKYRSHMLLNILSAWTNCVFTIDNDKKPGVLPAPRGEPWQDTDWIDGCPIVEGLIQLELNQIRYGDLIAQRIIDSDHKLSRAAHHFVEGLRFMRGASPSFYKLSTVHLVSSLEVISLPEDGAAPACSECGQPIYRISKRVVDFGVGHLGEGAEHILKSSYSKRSRYLHAGSSDFAQPMTAKTIPLLDPSAPEGCAMPELIEYPLNLMEFTSFSIRAEVRNYMKLFEDS